MGKIYTKTTWVDEVLAGAERFELLDNAGAAVGSFADLKNCQISLVTLVTTSGTPVNAENLQNIEDGVDALDTLIAYLAGGWIPAAATWTYKSASEIYATGDFTGSYVYGMKLRWKQGGGYKYANARACSAYDAGNNRTTLAIVVNTDHTVANSAITDNYYSVSLLAVGFPDYFNYTPTGISVTNVTLTGRYFMVGHHTSVDMLIAFSGGITFTTMPTLPMPCSTSYLSQGWQSLNECGVGKYLDYSPGAYGKMVPAIGWDTPTVVEIQTSSVQAINASTPIAWANLDKIELHFAYESN